MPTILEENVFFKCLISDIIHPTREEERKRADKSAEMWTVFRTYIKDGNRFVPRLCSGMAPHLDAGDLLTLTGNLVETEKYGTQFQFKGIQKQIPTVQNDIAKFLEKNINGIGEATASKIVEFLGPDTINKIETDYMCLSEVPGISEQKALKIYNQLVCMHSSLEELMFFAQIGLGATRISAVKTFYKDKKDSKGVVVNVIDEIKKNPYDLTAIKGIGFKVADSVALNLHISKTDPNRIKAGVEFALDSEVETKGNTWIDKDSLVKLAAGKNYLNLLYDDVEPLINTMVEEKRLIEEDERLYLPEYYELEKYVTLKLHEMMSYNSQTVSDFVIDGCIKKAERLKERELDEGQKNAVKLCANNNVSIVTGGPGTGKTTTLDILLYYLEHEENMMVNLAAPTGRAAKRMTEQTGRKASTIHSMNMRQDSVDLGIINGHRNVLVIDESSMVDIHVLKMIVDLCDVSTKLIFVGDVDQLPSIGPGQVLRDMIDSMVIPTAKLETIHRQGKESHIIPNAHAVIKGKHLVDKDKRDFFLSEKEDEESCLKSIKNFVVNVYPRDTGLDPKDVQVLAPLRRGLLGVANMNKTLQEAINPPSIKKQEIDIKRGEDSYILREGDKVIQTVNNYQIPWCDGNYTRKGVFNGEIGFIKEIVREDGELVVKVLFPDDKLATYDATMWNDLSLAYAITIHKSQGSEFRAVVLPLFSYGMPTIYNRNLLYTAITRAKEYCCIIGQEKTVNKMIHNNKVNKRRTTLRERLIETI